MIPTVRGGLLAAGLVGVLILSGPAIPRAEPPAETLFTPTATVHPPVARDAAHLWMVPSDGDRRSAAANPALVQLQAGLRLYAQEKYDQALARFDAAASPKSPLREHASYYAGVSELRLRRFESARRRFSGLKGAGGFIGEAAALGEAEAAQGMGDYKGATKVYEGLLKSDAVDQPAIWLSLATAALADGDRGRSAEAFLRLYYEHPLSEHAAQAEEPLQTMAEVQPIETGNQRYKLELGRAERLFGSRRYSDARTSFLRLKPHADGDHRELVALRLAEIDYFQGRHSGAREALAPYLTSGARQAEAEFFYLMSERGLGNHDTFMRLVRELAVEFPDSTWAEEALNNLATYYIQQDRDDEADAVLRDMYLRFPRGRYGERAAWKAGWRAYRTGNMADTARFFESAAVSFPRSDYRPSWLYWSGRARDAMGDREGALARYQLTIADYKNTYYGRLAATALAQKGSRAPEGNLIFARTVAEFAGEDDHFPATAGTIRTLLALGLYEPAVKELEFAANKWGSTPPMTATLAWANKQMADVGIGNAAVCPGAGGDHPDEARVPQFMAAGGEELPRDILTTIFPLSYWDLITKYSSQHDLDPYLVAALMAQESTFVRDIRSHANATGLMQLMAPTARRYARKFKLRYSAQLLTTPETNVRIGTAYFRRQDSRVRLRAPGACQLQRRRDTRAALACASAPATYRARSSSTTSRIPKPSST